MGLIDSAWGGTRLGEKLKSLIHIICRVEAWSTPEGLESCGAEGQINQNNPQVETLIRSKVEKDFPRTPTHICGTP